jgi:hypothetical protein
MLLRSVRATIFFIIVALPLMIGTARAQPSFSVDPSSQQILRSLDSDDVYNYIGVFNESNGTIAMSAQVIGSSAFRIEPATTFTIRPDSSRYSLRIVYNGEVDSAHAYIRITDGTDTTFVEYWGFTSLGDNPAWTLTPTSLFVGSGYSKPDSTYIYLQNNGNTSVLITPSILHNVGMRLLPSTAANLGPFGITAYQIDLNPTADSGSITVEFSGAGIRDTVTVRGKRATQGARWPWSVLFSGVAPGDTLCRDILLVDTLGVGMTIDSLVVAGNSTAFHIGIPSMPLNVSAGDTVVVNACFVAPSSLNALFEYIYVYYTVNGTTNHRMHPITLRGETQPCISASTDWVDFDTVPLNTSWTKSYFLRNHTGNSITIDSMFMPLYSNTSFTLSRDIPITIPAHDSVEVEVEYTADSSKTNYAQLVYWTDCGFAEIGFVGSPFTDPTSHGLQANETKTLDFIGDGSGDSVTYRFHNQLSDSIRVLNVTLAQGEHFQIRRVLPTWPSFKLGPADVMEVTILFLGPPGNYDDTLIIITEDGIMASRFPILGLIGTSAVHPEVASTVMVSISPNPAKSDIRLEITGGVATSIEVLDLLGHQVRSLDPHSKILTRERMSAGAYFIRVTGNDNEGKPFVITRSVVLE